MSIYGGGRYALRRSDILMKLYWRKCLTSIWGGGGHYALRRSDILMKLYWRKCLMSIYGGGGLVKRGTASK